MDLFLKPSLSKVCFKHTQNVFQYIPVSPNWSKNVAGKKNLRAITVLKKEGGGSGKVWSWSQIQLFFLKPSLRYSWILWKIFKNRNNILQIIIFMNRNNIHEMKLWRIWMGIYSWPKYQQIESWLIYLRIENYLLHTVVYLHLECANVWFCVFRFLINLCCYQYNICSAVQWSTVQCSAVQCSVVQCSALQCSYVKSKRKRWFFKFATLPPPCLSPNPHRLESHQGRCLTLLLSLLQAFSDPCSLVQCSTSKCSAGQWSRVQFWAKPSWIRVCRSTAV